jgi:hypothetical protein
MTQVLHYRVAATTERASTVAATCSTWLAAAGLNTSVLIELVPDGRFVTYGIGVPLMDMWSPEDARAVVPVD